MRRLCTEEQSAVRASFAAALGLALFYIRNNWRAPSNIPALFFEMLFVFVVYMYMPFVFSSLYLSALGYIVNLVRGASEFSVFTAALLLLAVLLSGYAIFRLQEVALLIVTGACFVVRLVRRL